MRIALFSAALLASGLTVAATPIDGLYGSVFGGYSYLPDNVNKNYHGNKFERAEFNGGYNVGGRFGYQSHPLRYEGEFTYIQADVKSFHSGRHQPFQFGPIRQRHRHVNGDTSSALGMANVYYDFPEMVPCISPFVGVGLGYGWVQTSMKNHNLLFRQQFKGSGSAFAYQGTAGFTFNFSENYALNLAYRYVGSTRVDDLGKNFQGNLASLGVVYRFNEYQYK
ncbi:Opacity protein antigens [Legionella massiliensis]|uniref:Opacity protein antigens n=1 Tax=Legionella massiliensis TaxID=1034943 RepID=A0A078KWD6_9GAMM|nr:outer membrane beta-barrel protein [Legionella massiliensis]CDZ78780.1 Opacity protein antigens [Legionella massiliensis]CEE14518.1 hypothetical protein BN1094_03094 [Legionella massiliensis]